MVRTGQPHALIGIATVTELIVHGLRALRDTLQQDKELNINNTSLAMVGKDQSFEIIEGEGLQKYLDMLAEKDSASGGSAQAPGASAPAPMEIE